MAFYDPEKDEEGQDGGAASPQTIGPESGVVAQGSQSPTAGAGAASPSASGSVPKRDPFVNISDYINANRPQSEKLAGQVVGNINSKAAGVDSALSGAQNSFNQAAESQKVSGDDSLFGQVANNAETVQKDPNLSNSFSKAYNAGYTGPQKLEDLDSGKSWAGIQSALQKANEAKAEAGTESGRMNLIKEVSNNPRQSQGGLVFDNLLLQSNPNAAAQLQNAGSNLNDFNSRLSKADTDAAAKAKAIADNNAAVKAQAANAVNQGYSNLYGAGPGADKVYGTPDDENLNLAGSLTGRVAATKAAQAKAYQDLQDRLTKSRLTDDDYKALGISANSPLYNVNPGDYLQQSADANLKNVANQTDFDRLAALNSLAGGAGQSFLNPTTDASLMGTAGKGYKIDQSGLVGKINANKQDYTAKLNDIVNTDGKDSPYTPEGIQNYTQWMLGGPPVAGMSPSALQDFMNSKVGQKIASLASQYGFNVPKASGGGIGSGTLVSGPGAPTGNFMPLVVKS